MAEKGWIKLHRSLQDCPIWYDGKFTKGQAWVDLLLLANHKDKKILFNGEIITVKKGQYLTSMVKLAEKWNWNRKTVSSYLNMLKKERMITKVSDNTKTLITIENYTIYQNVDETDGQPITQPNGQPWGNPLDTNKNDKNDKNVKNNKYTCAFEELWSVYPRRKEKAKAYKCYQARLSDGYSEDELLLAVKRYSQECKDKKTEEQFIKHAATFLGPNTPFLDYLRDYKPSVPKQGNKFNNFEGRTYDMASLEQQLLDN